MKDPGGLSIGGTDMNENAGQFRSAAFGGFHRQDVLDYIAELDQEHQTQLNKLKAQLKEKEEETGVLRIRQEDALADKARAEQELQTLKEEMAALREELERAQTEGARLKEELSGRDAQMEQTREEVKTLRDRMNELEPHAAAWSHLRDTAGNIEVAAHERAQVVIQEAKAQAAELQAASLRSVLDIQERCDSVQRELNNAIVAAETELDTARRAFARSLNDVSAIQENLSALVSAATAGEDTVSTGNGIIPTE